MLPPPSCWKAAPMLPTTLRERTVIPRTMPRLRTIRAPSMVNAVVTHRWSMGDCCCMPENSYNGADGGSDHAQHARSPGQCRNRSRVLDLAAQGRVERGAERHLAEDHVALVRLRGALDAPEAAGQEQVLAAGQQRRAPGGAQRRPLVRDETGLLAQLPLGAGDRLLARLDRAGGHLPGGLPPGVPPLPDQHRRAVLQVRDDED